MFIKRIETEKENCIFINESTRDELHIESSIIKLSFGSWEKEVEIMITSDIEINTIGLSSNLLVEYTILLDIEYDSYTTDNKLVIGPVLGIIIGSNYSKVTYRKVSRTSKWIRTYHKIKGLIIAFPLSEVSEKNLDNDLIRAYYYHPNKKKWIIGSFPVPSVVFKRSFRRVSGRKEYHRLIKKLGNQSCFNSNEPGKIEFFQSMNCNESAKELVPYTEVYTHKTDLNKLLDQYSILYLKTRYGGQGKGIIQLKKVGGKYIVTNTKRMKKEFANYTSMERYIRSTKKLTSYVVQQGVPYAVKGKNIDFRGYVQMNGEKEWELKGLIARIAKPGNIITNIHYTERLMLGKKALISIYNFDQDQASQVLKNIEDACKLASKQMNLHQGHYGDIALDFIVTEKGKLYFLEANCNYGHKSFFKTRAYTMKKNLLSGPMIYARALAGFPTS